MDRQGRRGRGGRHEGREDDELLLLLPQLLLTVGGLRWRDDFTDHRERRYADHGQTFRARTARAVRVGVGRVVVGRGGGAFHNCEMVVVVVLVVKGKGKKGEARRNERKP